MSPFQQIRSQIEVTTQKHRQTEKDLNILPTAELLAAVMKREYGLDKYSDKLSATLELKTMDIN